MSGIYLHIPFCRQACCYCDFHFSTVHRTVPEMVNAMHREIALRKDYLGSRELSTVYFGGGTPSLLSEEQLQQLLDSIRQHFSILPGAEITLEANPDDLTPEKLHVLRNAGINRLSIGIQSFNDNDLRFMKRAHQAGQAIRSVKEAQDSGFSNISIDLIYGLLGMTDAHWKEQLDVAFGLNVPHLSCYSLTVEPRTALASMIRKKEVEETADEQSAAHFAILMDRAADAGYEHYEISNFAKPGSYSRHNTSYWLGEKYLGIGPSAHSFDGISRQWNIANNPQYIRLLNEQEPVGLFEKEVLTENERHNERILIALRTAWGVGLDEFEKEFGAEAGEDLRRNARPHLLSGTLIIQEGKLLLTRSGKFFADRIASELFR